MKRITSLLLLVACSIATCLAQYKQVDNIPYSTSGDAYAKERCKLDVYYPEQAKDAPVVVWFHGGGLEGGGKFIPGELKNCGLVVIGVNYRLMPKGTIDNCIDDAAAAVAWAFKHAAEYGGSNKRIYVSGHSAGGYLTSMIGLQKSWLQKYGVDADSIAALIPFSGQAITHFNVRKPQGIPELTPTIDKYAPLFHVRKIVPPMVIVSGDRNLELFGRYEEQAYFWRMMKLNGNERTYLYEIQGYDHGGMAAPAFHILREFIEGKIK